MKMKISRLPRFCGDVFGHSFYLSRKEKKKWNENSPLEYITDAIERALTLGACGLLFVDNTNPEGFYANVYRKLPKIFSIQFPRYNFAPLGNKVTLQVTKKAFPSFINKNSGNRCIYMRFSWVRE